jgi:hypothetical protein
LVPLLAFLAVFRVLGALLLALATFFGDPFTGAKCAPCSATSAVVSTFFISFVIVLSTPVGAGRFIALVRLKSKAKMCTFCLRVGPQRAFM